MNSILTSFDRSSSKGRGITVEAIATTRYFSDWSFPEEWNFRGRRNKNVRTRKNKHATDPINTMLNFGYGLLAQQTSEFLLAKGFELSIGFIHQSEGGNRYWNMLAYDFIEPFRVWIDECVKEMIADKVIKPGDFTYPEDKSHMVFKDKVLDIALDGFLEKLEPLGNKCQPIIRTVEKML